MKSSVKEIKSWCRDIEKGAKEQAENLARHPKVFHHVALMPDCHQGYGMPIGGVIACENAVIPNAVGVDIGCGMGALQTDIPADALSRDKIRSILEGVKQLIPCGEGKAHRYSQDWEGLTRYEEEIKSGIIDKPGWFNSSTWDLASRNLGTLGGGNHFIEIQAGSDGNIWLMIHSGSRNLGYKIASFYNDLAKKYIKSSGTMVPCSDLAFLPANSGKGKAYIRDMTFAQNYARENRAKIMNAFKIALSEIKNCNFGAEINIHHNFAALETHFGKEVWVHRKGATSAQKGEKGIIPGSMGTHSYLVEGLGNSNSFCSCSHGAGRVMGRNEASRSLSVEECNKSMEGIVFDRWNKIRKGSLRGQHDLGEAPAAYKNIDAVINSELDLVKPLLKLSPLGVVKG